MSRATMSLMKSVGSSSRPPNADVYGRLRSLIVTGRIAPGTRLVETEFAERMAVSRTPVREAIRRLAQEGLAQVVRTGAKLQVAVAPATVADLIDLFAIIGALEGVAGRGVERLSTAQRRALARDLTALNARFAGFAKARRRDPETFFDSHDAFHAAFVARCASQRLQHVIGGVRPQVKRYELLYAAAVGRDFSASLREHRAIISAIRAGTVDQVERTIRVNWSNSARRLSAGLASMAIGGLGDYRSSDMG
jgi:DNA-binding GntR family transcriptional regulator